MHDAAQSFWHLTPRGLVLHIRAMPGAKQTRIVGVTEALPGQWMLKIAVTAPPENGKANAALVSLLAKHFRRPKREFSWLCGETDKHKQLCIHPIPVNYTECCEALTNT